MLEGTECYRKKLTQGKAKEKVSKGLKEKLFLYFLFSSVQPISTSVCCDVPIQLVLLSGEQKPFSFSFAFLLVYRMYQ